MQDRIRLGSIAFQNLDGLNCGQDEQFNSAPFGFPLHLRHHRKRACASADHEAAALPRYLFLEGEWRVSEFGAVFLGRFLLAFTYPPAVNHHIMFVGDAIDANGTEGKILETHDPSLSELYSQAGEFNSLRDGSCVSRILPSVPFASMASPTN